MDEIFKKLKEKKNVQKKPKTEDEEEKVLEEVTVEPPKKKTKKPVVTDEEFFDLRGGKGKGDDAVAEENGNKWDKIVVAGLEPSVQKIYEHIILEELKGLGRPAQITVDWTAHVVRVEFAQAEEAIAAASILDRKTIFSRPIRVGMTSSRDGEVLLRNILSHVTQDIIVQHLSSFGTIISCTLLSHHAVWQKAYITFADEADAVRCVKSLHGTRNTIQDAPVFLSLTANSSLATRLPPQPKKRQKTEDPEGRGEGEEEEEEEEEKFVYNHTEGY